MKFSSDIATVQVELFDLGEHIAKNEEPEDYASLFNGLYSELDQNGLLEEEAERLANYLGNDAEQAILLIAKTIQENNS